MNVNPSEHSSPTGEPVLSVSQLSLLIKETLEGLLSSVWVAGEISNLRRPQSGHVYFDLKDESAVLHAVLWRTSAARLRFEMQDGQQVLCHGGIDVYPPHGKYQLIARRLEPLGEGALQLAFRQLHARLEAEGLFAAGRKRALPKFPRRIAFVTSPTGAAIRDFLQIAARRWQAAEVLVIPARVQGDSAAAEVASGIAIANQLAEPPDVIVVGRGGGSLEDLWCFNEELLVRAIHASRIPVVSAVGHEIDVTLADLVADLRAPTPSAAAELVVPDRRDVEHRLRQCRTRMVGALRGRALRARQQLGALARHRALRRPLDWLHDLAQRVDECDERLRTGVNRHIADTRQRLAHFAARLESLSPLAVLGRGYALTMRQSDGQVVRRAADVQPGEAIVTRVARGTITSSVTQVTDDETA